MGPVIRWLVVVVLLLGPTSAWAAFPTVETTSVGFSATTASANHTVTLPSGVVAGNLLVTCVAGDAFITGFSWPAGWTESHDTDQGNVVLSCAYRVADGTEGASITVASIGSDLSAYMAYRISGQHASSAPEVGTATVGASTTPNPPTLAPSWGGEDTLWLVVAGLANSHHISAFPTSYVSGIQPPANGSGKSAIGSAQRALLVTSEDPGPFSVPSGGSWAAQTIAIRPAGAGGNPAPVATGMVPSSAIAGGSDFTLTVTGSGFVPSSVVRWNGSDRVTTYVSGAELRAAIGAGDIATTGTASVTVFTPSPGGGLSGALTFTITPPSGSSGFPTVEATSVGVAEHQPCRRAAGRGRSGQAARRLRRRRRSDHGVHVARGLDRDQRF
jgi:hypothetical protein